MIIGVIGAMQIEIDNLKKTLENPSYESISGVEFVKGTIGGTEVVAAVSGVGKVFAAICTEAMIPCRYGYKYWCCRNIVQGAWGYGNSCCGYGCTARYEHICTR